MAAHLKWCDSGVGARWCARCGDCTCPDDDYPTDTPDCPLHSPDSDHGELVIVDLDNP